MNCLTAAPIDLHVLSIDATRLCQQTRVNLTAVDSLHKLLTELHVCTRKRRAVKKLPIIETCQRKIVGINDFLQKTRKVESNDVLPFNAARCDVIANSTSFAASGHQRLNFNRFIISLSLSFDLLKMTVAT